MMPMNINKYGLEESVVSTDIESNLIAVGISMSGLSSFAGEL